MGTRPGPTGRGVAGLVHRGSSPRVASAAAEKQPVVPRIGQPRQNYLSAEGRGVAAGEWGSVGSSAAAPGDRHLLAMDDQAALLERQVAMAASAWRHAKADTEAYRRLVVATHEWD